MSTELGTDRPTREQREARNAVFVVFAAAGFALANWLARLPVIRDALDLTPGRLGLVLMGVSLGSMVTLPLSGWLVDRWRTGPSIWRGAAAVAVGLSVAGVAGGGVWGGVPLFVATLVVIGSGVALWDVAMNVEGALVEQVLGKAIMPWFHAAFSFGTVAGALFGAVAAALMIPVPLHFAAIAVTVLAAVWWALRRFLPPEAAVLATQTETSAQTGPESPAGPEPQTEPGWSPWREPRTVMIGLLVLGMALSEGSANDWVAVGLVDDFGLSHAAGAVGLGVFLSAMTVCRLAGPRLLERHGRVPVLRAGALSVVIGLGLYVAAGELARAAGVAPGSHQMAGPVPLTMAALGIVFWGAGAALGFPVGMSAASDDPVRAARRVSVVASIGYLAFLAGPPLLGLVADQVGIVRSLSLVAAAAVLSFVVAGAARPLRAARGA